MYNTLKNSQTGFHIVGAHIKAEGYPNVQIRTGWLHGSCGLPEINVPAFGPESHKEKERWSPGYYVMLAKGIHFVFAHMKVLLKFFRQGRPSKVYVPYPAIFLLYLFSLVPSRYRPKELISDVFISLYDTIVVDRRLVSDRGVIARLIKKIERRAYEVTTLLITDTDLNASYLSKTFGLPRQKVITVPLSIDETAFRAKPYIEEKKSTIVVLFVGTFVPLQGVGVIAHAARLLKDIKDVRFRIIGYGQSASEVENILSEYGGCNVSWEKNWMSSKHLSFEIEKADICLGIFGKGDKAQRVWPIKNYIYMAVGRALITGDTSCARALKSVVDYEPFLTVPTDNPEAIAESINWLAKDPYLRVKLSNNSREYYNNYLSSRISEKKLADILRIYHPINKTQEINIIK